MTEAKDTKSLTARHSAYLDQALCYLAEDPEGHLEWMSLPEETARLYRAAPELLEACKHARDQLRDAINLSQRLSSGGDCDHNGGMWWDAFTECERAIAKATQTDQELAQ